MILIIGLGNPGEKFNNTPHNIGFEVLDKFAIENNFPDFELQKKSEALISEGIFGEEKIILVKPQTFMNESGKSVKKILEKIKDQASDIIVIHDDIDLPQGKIKIVKGRGSAGHKGVESIIKNIGNENLVRVRVGVIPVSGKPKNPENFVLQKTETLDEIIQKAANALDLLVKEGLDGAMNEYNK